MTSFTALNWSPNELIDESKMDALANNMQYLYDRTPRVQYKNSNGTMRLENTKIASGRVLIPKNLKSDTGVANVNFSGFFSTICSPVITTATVATFTPRIHTTIRGIGQLTPDSTGFRAVINVAATTKAKDKIAGAVYVSWTAVGF